MLDGKKFEKVFKFQYLGSSLDKKGRILQIIVDK